MTQKIRTFERATIYGCVGPFDVNVLEVRFDQWGTSC